MKKIVIFGSTGMTGLCAVEAAVNKGLSVRAFVRDPAKVPAHLKDKLEIFQGNVLEPDSVHDAVEGTDGVVIVLGTRNALEPTSDMSEGTKNILEAMRAKNVKNVSACLSAFLFWSADKVPPRFNDLNEDHKRMYQALKDNEPSREMIITVNPENGPGRTISKWDLGSFLVDSLSEPKYYKSVIGIANVPKQ
ncbi:Flavin reductase [Operophtera brumata]|uniref:Flavin reductase n=1 Tax=Operophtera brumata TaxID=104452 RepID=A0A0L7L7A5_OPEBR|nr:Flavin reductase [Operophtera brumata]